MASHAKGTFVISLDLELFWGMVDKASLDSYGANILGEQQAIPAILDLFKRYELHATWATVGMLMCKDKESLMSIAPETELRPTYPDKKMSTYTHIEGGAVGHSENDDKYHFGNSLILQIQNTTHQEIASHTFSHYYCLDGEHNTPEVFAADCRAMTRIGNERGITLKSIVFPRNQVTKKALTVCKEFGISHYRGTEDHFLYKPRKDCEQSRFVRALRLLDHYINISGHNTHKMQKADVGEQINVPASRFLRAYSSKLKFLEPLRLHRIKRAMTYAAKHGEMYHLWWHPHNFGVDLKENMRILEAIAKHYTILHAKYGMESRSMHEFN